MQRAEVPMWLHAGSEPRAEVWFMSRRFSVQEWAALETSGPEREKDQPKYPVQTQLSAPCQRGGGEGGATKMIEAARKEEAKEQEMDGITEGKESDSYQSASKVQNICFSLKFLFPGKETFCSSCF